MGGWRLAALPLAVAGLIAVAAPALAQAKYPSRPIRIVLPFAAGSVSDVTLRILADKLGPRLGTTVIVDNQPRAGGTTAAAAALTSARDGYTLVTFSSSTAIKFRSGGGGVPARRENRVGRRVGCGGATGVRVRR